MRFLKKYRFQVGKKMDFQNLFAAIDGFLRENGLHYNSMGYDLLDMDLEEMGVKSNCLKLVEKMPQFGPVERIEEQYSDKFRLSNMDNPLHLCDEASVRWLGSKIPRPYNFFQTNIYYRNISFYTGTTEEDDNLSNIRLCRDSRGPQSTVIFMTIEVTDRKTNLGADDYAASLSTWLGNPKFGCEVKVCMDDAEKKRYEQWKAEAKSIVEAAKLDIYGRCDAAREEMLCEFQDFEEKRFQIGTIIQRIGKRHGFDQYTHVPGDFSYISKRVTGGNYLRLEFGSFSGCGGYEAGLILSGPGFSYKFSNFSGAPENSKEAQWYISRLFEIIDYFEAEYMSRILALYPDAPDWLPMCLDA